MPHPSRDQGDWTDLLGLTTGPKVDTKITPAAEERARIETQMLSEVRTYLCRPSQKKAHIFCVREMRFVLIPPQMVILQASRSD